LVGVAAVAFSLLYFLSDVIELAHDGFSTGQLLLTLVAEATIPLFVIGLYVVQRPRIGRLGFAGAVGYAYTFVFFTGTVVFALVKGTPDWDALVHQMSPWVTVHGAAMVVAGLAFGLAVVRARVLPHWTGWALMAGVVLVAASSGLPGIVQTASAGVRDLAFAGMGTALLRRRQPNARSSNDGTPPAKRRIGYGILDALSGIPLFATAPLYRHWHLRWGATDEEVRGSMPGDEIIPRASFNATRAITIDAPPEMVWPWIVQMGYRRAGFYTYALLDNAGYESADRILEEYQPPKVGDWMPMAKKINDATAFKVKAFEICEWLLWEKPDSTWAWKLVPLDGGRTRLVTRLKALYAWRKPSSAILSLSLLEFGDFPMIRRVLKGIKVRAERMKRSQAVPPTESRTPKSGRVAVIKVEADIRRSPEVVFDYASDPAHEPDWNIRMKSLEKLIDGPLGVGARYRMEFTQGPPAISECAWFDRPSRWELVGGSKIIRSSFRGQVEPIGEGSHLVLRMEIRLRGPLGLALPLVRHRMQRELGRDIATIKAKLEGSEWTSVAPL
jgi:uncharacterized protein YndB with AHSA1/START domain